MGRPGALGSPPGNVCVTVVSRVYCRDSKLWYVWDDILPWLGVTGVGMGTFDLVDGWMDIYEARRILSCVVCLPLDLPGVEVYTLYLWKVGYGVLDNRGSGSRIQFSEWMVRSGIRDKRVSCFGIKTGRENESKE
jgi:hypothetical protein